MAFVYLASPYYHRDREVSEDRFRRTAQHVAYMLEHPKPDLTTFSPIVYCHYLKTHLSVPLINHPYPESTKSDIQFRFWINHDFHMLKLAKEMQILALDGWKQSRGIKAEFDFCRTHNIPVYCTKMLQDRDAKELRQLA